MPFSLTDVEQTELENGLRILSREDRSVPIVTTMIWYRVGSRDERPGQTGIAHFIEHMLFKGTRKFGKGEIDLITTANGGMNNAFTSQDFTAYYFSFASDRWLPALEIEADRMVNTSFDPEEFELERQVILDEIRMGLDNPWENMHQVADAASFPDHPYGNPIIGQWADVAGVARETVLDFYSHYYVPASATLVLVGDFRTSEALRHIESLFGPISNGAKAPERPVLPPPVFAGPRAVEIRQPSHVSRLLVSLPGPAVASPDFVPFLLLDKILSQGKLSRLHQRLVEQEELAGFVTTEFEETQDPYSFAIRIELDADIELQAARLATAEVLSDLIDRRVDDAELRKAKNQCITQLFGDLESGFDQAFQLGLFDLLDHWQRINQFIEGIQEVDAEDLRQCAARYLRPDRAVECTLCAGDGHA